MILARIILGLLDLAPMTGYDIKRQCSTTISHFWQADKAQIYRTLARLTEDGLATVESVPGVNAPDRQIHHITGQGRDTLRTWLTAELDDQPHRDAFLARLFFSGSLSDAQLTTLLDSRRADAQRLLTNLEEIRATTAEPTDRRSRMRWATLDNGIAHARAELRWLATLENELS